MNGITLCLPTRGRPERFRRMVESAVDTAERPDLLQVIYYLSDDDHRRDDYPDPSNMLFVRTDRAVMICGPAIPNTHAWNACCNAADGPIYMQAGDDLVFRTVGWDTAFRSAFDDDRLLLVHGCDGSKHDDPHDRTYVQQGSAVTVRERFAAHVTLHQAWVDAVGYLVPPQMDSQFCDVWVNELADLIGRRRFLPSVLIEHMHPAWGKRASDETDARRMADDLDAFDRYVALVDDRARDLMRLQLAIGGKVPA